MTTQSTDRASMPPPSASALRTAHSALLEPKALAQVGHMELVAKQVMDGYVQGLHRSPHIGFALDFAQHRQYVPGDDIKRIDWRVYAKNDRYYIKQYEVSTSLRATLLVDVSASMSYQGRADALSKLRYAQFVASCLTYLVLRQKDSAGLVTFDREVREFIPPRSASNHLRTITETLDRATPTEEGAIAPVLHQIAERIKARGLVIVLSDLFEKADDLIEAFHHLRHKRHEVIVLQIMASDELTFPFRAFSVFRNLEQQAQQVKADPALMRSNYLAALARHLKALRDGTSKLGIDYELLDTSAPFERVLTGYLARRMGSR